MFFIKVNTLPSRAYYSGVTTADLSLDVPLGRAHVQQRVSLGLERLADQSRPIAALQNGVGDPVRAFKINNGIHIETRGLRGSGSKRGLAMTREK